ncbi:MAG: sugar phosphate isomerase/epimerase family protein [Pseudomonadota bacterium]
MTPPLYATRLNAFRSLFDAPTPLDLIAAAGRVGGLTAADLNYPDQFQGATVAQVQNAMADNGLALNGLAMRYYTDPGFKLGALTHPDADIRQKALDLTRQGLDVLAQMGGRTMTIWLGQDGFDYAFQADYAALWDRTITGLTAIADHAPELDIAIEYKPNEPRAYALMPDVATTLLAVKEIGRPNVGVTLDFAHVLYADEMPAHTAHLIARHGRLMGVHLNDGYAKRDDGLMVGTVHPVQTVELFAELDRIGYTGAIYFDTFPDQSGLDPVEEARTNLVAAERLRAAAERLRGNNDLADAIAAQDATRSQRIVQAALFA